MGWASNLHEDVTSSCSGSLHSHGNSSIKQDLPGKTRSRREHPPQRLQLEPHPATLWIPSPKSHLRPVSCLIPKTALRPQPPTPNQETPGKTSPPKSYNRAAFMLLLQVLAPWNRVERGRKRNYRVSGTDANCKRPREGSLRTEWETSRRPTPRPQRQGALETEAARRGLGGLSERQRPGASAGQRFHNIYRQIHHPQASSFPTSSHPEQFWADGGSGGGREACLGPPWRQEGQGCLLAEGSHPLRNRSRRT